MSWDELHAFVSHAPPTSAIEQAKNPDAWITGEVELLREIEHGIRVLFWAKTKDASATVPRNYPEPLSITAADKEAERLKNAPQYDATSLAEMADFLGWPRPKSA